MDFQNQSWTRMIFTWANCKKYAKKRFPITEWLPGYEKTWILEDALAGITVGLTAIPQGIAYGIVAGLNPEYGMYAAFMASFVYIFFGSNKNITIGPTAIMALMIQPLVLNWGPDMAVLICFLKGCIITILAIFHLGFLLDFISLPVITGFTSGAALTIASSQFRPILGIPGGSSGFIDSIVSVFRDIRQIGWWDTLLGFSSIAFLLLLKNLPGRRGGNWCQKIMWMIGLARNALVVVIGTSMAYVFYTFDMEPFQLTGSMGQGIPPFTWPPFSTTFEGESYGFWEMVNNMGLTLITIPVISTIEHIAISKAFSMGRSLDATQEMFALGLSNILGSFVRSMPVTGSFTRTAVNYASGVRTPLGGLFTGCLVMLAVGLLTATFRFIPRATLSSIILTAMYFMLDFETAALLWRAKKTDFAILVITLVGCVFLGLELGIVIGITSNLLLLLFYTLRPKVEMREEQIDGMKVIQVIPDESVTFPAAENIRNRMMKLSEKKSSGIVFNGKNIRRIDVTVAKNIKLLARDMSILGQNIVFINCSKDVETMIKTVAPELSDRFRADISERLII